MIIVQVALHVKLDHIAPFKVATIEKVQKTRQEPGCVRIELYQMADDPQMFTLFEIYEDDAALQNHMAAAHFVTWKQTTREMFASPGYGEQYHAVDPTWDHLRDAAYGR